jgi:hypothetical protein
MFSSADFTSKQSVSEGGGKEVRYVVILGEQVFVERANLIGHILMRVHGFAHALPPAP